IISLFILVINILSYYNEIVGESPTEHIKRVDIKKKGLYRHGKFNNNGEKYGKLKISETTHNGGR
ncbi:hypothetical protein BU685_11290, partial [Staphylococcus chromogenes]|uniref:hypothetical protein n=1 Tax=Staphylococcus chromogenes TaxID=46126 RepID=UPI000D44E5C3